MKLGKSRLDSTNRTNKNDDSLKVKGKSKDKNSYCTPRHVDRPTTLYSCRPEVSE